MNYELKKKTSSSIFFQLSFFLSSVGNGHRRERLCLTAFFWWKWTLYSTSCPPHWKEVTPGRNGPTPFSFGHAFPPSIFPYFFVWFFYYVSFARLFCKFSEMSISCSTRPKSDQVRLKSWKKHTYHGLWSSPKKKSNFQTLHVFLHFPSEISGFGSFSVKF